MQQAISTPTSPTAVTIHSVFDSQGRRIAEYNEATGALIREYVWNCREAIAVIEGGAISYIRTDHIGRRVFATNSTGAVVWTASYLPFGGVRTTTGVPLEARFPGQWFQSECGLHQNWMRDYDPTTGRYIEADPLGLVDGASVYGYAGQNPMMNIDLRGEDTIAIPGVGGGINIGGAIGQIGKGLLGVYGMAVLGSVWGSPTSNTDTQYIEVDGVTCMNGCPPCKTKSGKLVSVGTKGYRYVSGSRGHYPYTTGEHVHMYEARQNPTGCKCFWKNLYEVTNPPPSPDAININKDQNNGFE